MGTSEKTYIRLSYILICVQTRTKVHTLLPRSPDPLVNLFRGLVSNIVLTESLREPDFSEHFFLSE